MKTSNHTLKLQGSDDLLEVKHFPEKGHCHVVAQLNEETLAAKASDYFEAFCQIRTRLERSGLIPICNGSSLDVYPSGMCRDMGAGLSAYRLYTDRKPEMDDLVKIFEVDEPLKPSTVADQRKYFETWAGIEDAVNSRKKWWQFWR